MVAQILECKNCDYETLRMVELDNKKCKRCGNKLKVKMTEVKK